MRRWLLLHRGHRRPDVVLPQRHGPCCLCCGLQRDWRARVRDTQADFVELVELFLVLDLVHRYYHVVKQRQQL